MPRPHRTPFRLALCLAGVSLAAAAGAVEPAQDTTSDVVPGQMAPRLQTLGDLSHPITTSSPRAQLFFDQGLILSYGFNHKEAARSFAEAARLDPSAPMPVWGQALVLGPNINAPMDPANERRAWELVQKARSLAASGSERERAYVEALAARYTGDPEPDRAALDRAYAEAMGRLHAAYPDDLDAAVLHAEALMDLSPWDYWTPDGQPHAHTPEILRLLEAAMARDPDHPGANHFYIHAVEAVDPKRAEGAADRLAGEAPGAGHLQHMPSHIYAQIGRFEDATRANHRAIAADEDYIVTCRAQGIYPLAYYPHNVHFLWWTTSLEGRGDESVAAARKVLEKTEPFLGELPPFGQVFPVTPLYALLRFGRWEEILAEPEPPAGNLFWQGIWRHARGLALARTGRHAEAAVELAKLRVLAAQPSQADVVVGGNQAAAVLELAATVLEGELAAERGRYDEAIAHLHRAVLLQGGLYYVEPPDWYYPVRQSLGAVLLDAGRPAEAEVVYWRALEDSPENGWTLFGLAQALRAQGKDASAVEARLARAWSRADVELTASRF